MFRKLDTEGLSIKGLSLSTPPKKPQSQALKAVAQAIETEDNSSSESLKKLNPLIKFEASGDEKHQGSDTLPQPLCLVGQSLPVYEIKHGHYGKRLICMSAIIATDSEACAEGRHVTFGTPKKATSLARKKSILSPQKPDSIGHQLQAVRSEIQGKILPLSFFENDLPELTEDMQEVANSLTIDGRLEQIFTQQCQQVQHLLGAEAMIKDFFDEQAIDLAFVLDGAGLDKKFEAFQGRLNDTVAADDQHVYPASETDQRAVLTAIKSVIQVVHLLAKEEELQDQIPS